MNSAKRSGREKKYELTSRFNIDMLAQVGQAVQEKVVASRGYALTGPGSLQMEKNQLGELKPGWVRLRFLYCGLCGSDLAHFAGRPDASYPVSIGHEFIAEVTEVGDGVELLSTGDLVTSDLNYRCGTCDHCLAGRSHLCRIGQQGLFSNRAFSELGDIEATYLVALNGPVKHHLALSEPLSCVLHAKRWASPRDGERILVLGAGGLGLCMAFALCRQRPALEFEITDLLSGRLAMISDVISPQGRGVPEPNGEYDLVFDLSGTEEGLRTACVHVRDGGKICSMSHPNGEQVSPFFVSEVLRKDVTFTASYLNGEPIILREAASLLEREWDSEWDGLIEILPVKDLQGAYENRPSSPWCKTVIDVSSGFD
jgi:threonine dehydrogenase-like Zn-dependent dehydrogenase